MPNIDRETVAGFGEEWAAFDQTSLPEREAAALFGQYFDIFPCGVFGPAAQGFDLGCGSGRWATRVAPQVGRLHCIDASSQALDVARRNLLHLGNCEFHHASVESIPLDEASMDFGYSLGVLHHVPDTRAGIESCARKLKVGAPLLLYLYYDFEGRPLWFRTIWRATNLLRLGISRLPRRIKRSVTSMIAAVVYLPLARLAKIADKLGLPTDHFPLAYYKSLSFYTMRTDALDRFGTRLEKRFSRAQIEDMMREAGLERIVLSTTPPYWCAVGYRTG